jgi:acetolactate synthase-1/2/3 large subunit
MDGSELMNGAEALIGTLSESGVDVCFANPGTSEMQLVAALDRRDDMRAILCLFEGVATGAADGYGRMADKPAITLLHLGPGLGNGVANLHNARRARSPIVNIVGDHATYHLKYDAPLTSDILGLARPVSDWVRESASVNALAADGAAAVAASRDYPGKVATLIVPADFAWSEAENAAPPAVVAEPQQAERSAIDAACEALRSGEPAALFLGGMALREDALVEAGRIAEATGARLVCETFPARLQRGGGRPPVERLPYFGEAAVEALKDFRHVILVGAKTPAAFFAYPGKPSLLIPEGVNCLTLAEPREDAYLALKAAADALQALANAPSIRPRQGAAPSDGPLDPMSLGAVLAELMPENAIVSDEAATASLALFPATAGAPPHDWLALTGGAIGQGLPVGIGAAVACPDRKVICLQADGSAMYTVQSLWTMAREKLDIVTIIINNSSYAILNIELQRVGAGAPGPKALSLLDLGNPPIDWVSLSRGMGVPAFREALAEALAAKGPRLVEAVVPAR